MGFETNYGLLCLSYYECSVGGEGMPWGGVSGRAVRDITPAALWRERYERRLREQGRTAARARRIAVTPCG